MKPFAAISMSLLFCASATAQEKTPDAKVLDQWVGNWKTEFVNRVSEWNPKEVKSTGAITCKWILNGKFVEEAGASTAPGVEHRVLWWYDPEQKLYRLAFYSSEGTTITATGTWDEKTKTLTSKSDGMPGMTAVSTNRFLSPDLYEWTYVIRDAGGKSYLDMKGRHTRMK